MGHKYKDVAGMAQAIMDRFDKSMVCIITVDAETGKNTVIATGKHKKDKEAAVQSANFIKRTLGIK